METESGSPPGSWSICWSYRRTAGGVGGFSVGKGIAVPGKQKILQCAVQIDSLICNVDAGRQGVFYVAGNNLHVC